MTTVDSPVENERVKTRQMPGIPKIKRCESMRSELLPLYVGGFDLQSHRHCHHHSDRHHHHLGHIGDAKRYKKRRVRGKKKQDVGYFGGLVLGPADDAPGGLAGMDMDKRGS